MPTPPLSALAPNSPPAIESGVSPGPIPQPPGLLRPPPKSRSSLPTSSRTRTLPTTTLPNLQSCDLLFPSDLLPAKQSSPRVTLLSPGSGSPELVLKSSEIVLNRAFRARRRLIAPHTGKDLPAVRIVSV